MKRVVKRRAYHSDKRQKQAEETRAAIVAGARRLFARGGYKATTLDAIAQEAGVSVQTVYSVFGSKRAVLLAISDDMDRRVDFGRLQAELAASPDPIEQLRLMATAQVDFFAHNADVLEPLREARRTDESLDALWREGLARHRAAYARLVKTWATRQALRPGLEPREATDVASALAWGDTYWYFTEHCGWTPERYRDWLVIALSRLILKQGEERSGSVAFKKDQ